MALNGPEAGILSISPEIALTSQHMRSANNRPSALNAIVEGQQHV